MYRITESILLSYHTNIDELSQEDLFTELSSMIADILAACLTNLPQVIVTKCHENVIEKRESSVNATVQLLADKLLSCMSEGLAYVTLVKESLNATHDYVRIQKVAKRLWLEVEVCHAWSGNKLRTLAPPAKNIAGH
ncbi:hypothetical protein Tco_1510604 [Tanacetum coccineum]